MEWGGNNCRGQGVLPSKEAQQEPQLNSASLPAQKPQQPALLTRAEGMTLAQLFSRVISKYCGRGLLNWATVIETAKTVG